jgi:hypothetical protein
MTTVLVKHPAPVSYVPPRKRNEVDALVTLSTPARLVHAPRDGFEPVLVPFNSAGIATGGILRNEDGLWQPMSRKVGYRTEHVVRTGHLVAFLEGNVAEANLNASFVRTPVAAPTPPRPGGNSPLEIAHRGEAIDLDSARSFRVDGRALCAEGVALHLSRNVRIVAGGGAEQVYERFVPAMAMTDPQRTSHSLWRVFYDLNHADARGLVCQPSDMAAMETLAGRLGIRAIPDPSLATAIEALGPGDWDEDIRTMVVNVYAGTVRHRFDGAMANAHEIDATPEWREAMRTRLRTMDRFSQVGLAHAGDVRNAAYLLAEPLQAVNRGLASEGRRSVLEAVLTGFHLRSRESRHAEAEDLAALEAMAPAR